jgi:hypothetical protein
MDDGDLKDVISVIETWVYPQDIGTRKSKRWTLPSPLRQEVRQVRLHFLFPEHAWIILRQFALEGRAVGEDVRVAAPRICEMLHEQSDLEYGQR